MHRYRYRKYGTFSLPGAPDTHDVVTHSEYRGAGTGPDRDGGPGLSELPGLTSGRNNPTKKGALKPTHSDLPLAEPLSTTSSDDEPLTDDEIRIRYTSTIHNAITAFGLDASYAAAIVQRAKRVMHIRKDERAW